MPVVDRIDTTWFEVKRTNIHSKKPLFFRELIDSIYGDVPKIELFARERVKGWDVIGYDIDGLDIKESINLYKEK